MTDNDGAKYRRTVAVVRGYLDGDTPYRNALRIGRVARTAVVLPSYDRDSVDAEFDRRVYELLIEGLASIVETDEIVVEDGHIERRCRLQELHDMLRLIEDHNAFSKVTFLVRGMPSALVEYEPWVNVGGRYPYHDSHTFVILSASGSSSEILAMAQRICAECGYDVENIEGTEAPTLTWGLSNLWSFIRRRCSVI